MPLNTLNWKRGLLRLWAICSIIWIGIAIVFINPLQKIRDARADTRAQVTFTFAGRELKIQADTSLVDVKRGLDTFVRNGRKEIPEDVIPLVSGPGTDFKEVLKEGSFDSVENYMIGDYKPKDSVPQIIFVSTERALIPPLLALGFGFAGLWIGRGFRR